MVATSNAKWFTTVLCLLLVSCSTTKETSRSLTTDYIGVQNFRLSDTLDLYYFPTLRDCMYMQNLTDFEKDSALINSEQSQKSAISCKNIQNRPYFHTRAIRHTTANVEDTNHYQLNEQEQVTTAKQPPAPILDTGRKIVLSLIIFFGFVFIGLVVLVIWKLLRLTGSQ